MYNSQYYTCEQIDERLLQGYLDDYNTQTGQSLTKAQFLTKLGSIFSKEGVIDNTATQIGYYECDTAAGTAAKTITVANYALFAGGSMKVKFANKNTANNATLNINSQGAKALYYQGERASATNSWDAEEVVEIYYDGTSYYANNVKGGSGSGVYDVSKEHPTSGPNSDGKFTLEYILNSSNVNELIPVNKRYPGMTIQFVSTSDNKYVQFRYMGTDVTTAATFTNTANWQGIDNVPTTGSDNLVKSRGVFDCFIKGSLPKIYQGVWGGPVDGKVIYNKYFDNRVCVEILPACNAHIKLKEGFLFRQIMLVDANINFLEVLVSATNMFNEYDCNRQGFLAITICKSDESASISPVDEPVDNIWYNEEEPIESLLKNLTDDLTIITGNEVGTIAPLTKTTNFGWKSGVIETTPGSVFYVEGNGGNNARLYAFLDSENRIIECFGNDNIVSSGAVIRIVAPANTAKLVVNLYGKFAIFANRFYNRACKYRKGIDLVQGAATESHIHREFPTRVTCVNKMASPFILKTKPGYVIRAIAEYDAATGEYRENVASTSETRTQWHQGFSGNNVFYVPTFAKVDSTQVISPNEEIIDFVEYNTQYEESYKLKATPAPNKGLFMGDSITYGVYSAWHYDEDQGADVRWNAVETTNRISDWFAKFADMEIYNLGKRGTGYVADTRHLGNALAVATSTNFANYDFVALCFGVNDYIQGVDIGTIEDNVEGTMIGNMIRVITKILTDNPYCHIVIYSPFNTWGQVNKGSEYISYELYGDESTNYALGALPPRGKKYLQHYIDAEKQVADYFGIKMVRLDIGNAINRVNIKETNIDGLHPSIESRPYIALQMYKESGL